jgi:transglutaminase-like putative cysteine protease
MSFSAYFKMASYGMLFAGFLALASTGRVDPASLVIYAAALTATWFVRLQSLRISKRMLNLSVLSYILFYTADYFMLARDFRLTSIHLLFFVALLKLLTLRSDRDYFYLFVISFLQLLAATTLTVSILFLIPLFLFLMSSISTLVLFEMKRTARLVKATSQMRLPRAPNQNGGDELDHTYYFSAAPLLAVSILLSLSISVLSVPIFFTIPRLSIGLLTQRADKSQMISGFSEQVRLGEIGSIKQNPAVVMHVKLEGADRLSEDAKWAGVMLDKYDGQSWSRSDTRRAIVNSTHQPLLPINQRFYKVAERQYRHRILEQTIHLEPLNTGTIFAAQRLVSIVADWPALYKDPLTGSLSLPQPPTSRMRYKALSEVIHPNREALRESSTTVPDHLKQYLKLPESLDPRVGRLARDVTKTESNLYDKALRLESFLKTNYKYSLDLKAGYGDDPIADFLFTTKAGHCEYFASAMALMLRSLGVPTRLVNGFRRGEFNELDNNYIVRQSDAHSWLQAFFPGYGEWVEFDPTPPDPVQVRNKARKFIANLIDAIEMFWAEQVVNYDLWKQVRFLREAKAALREFEFSMTQLNNRVVNAIRSNMGKVSLPDFSHTTVKTILLPMIILLVGVAVLLALRRRPWLLGLDRRGRRTVAMNFYVQMLDLLGARGMIRSPDKTPMEFSRELADRREAVYVNTITKLYNKARYSGAAISDEELRQVTESLKELKESLRKTKSEERGVKSKKGSAFRPSVERRARSQGEG